MAEANCQVQGPFRGRGSGTSFKRPKYRLPDRQSDSPGGRQNSMLWDGLLRGLHSNTLARKGLHLSALRVESGLVGQVGRRQANAP